MCVPSKNKVVGPAVSPAVSLEVSKAVSKGARDRGGAGSEIETRAA